MKKTLLIFLVIALVLMTVIVYFFGRTLWREACRPAPGTAWQSEDGMITFRLQGGSLHGMGKMIVNGQTIEGDFWFDEGNNMGVDVGENLSAEKWSVSYKSKTCFVVTVEKTTNLHKGDLITFYRIDDS